MGCDNLWCDRSGRNAVALWVSAPPVKRSARFASHPAQDKAGILWLALLDTRSGEDWARLRLADAGKRAKYIRSRTVVALAASYVVRQTGNARKTVGRLKIGTGSDIGSDSGR